MRRKIERLWAMGLIVVMSLTSCNIISSPIIQLHGESTLEPVGINLSFNSFIAVKITDEEKTYYLSSSSTDIIYDVKDEEKEYIEAHCFIIEIADCIEFYSFPDVNNRGDIHLFISKAPPAQK